MESKYAGRLGTVSRFVRYSLIMNAAWQIVVRQLKVMTPYTFNHFYRIWR